MVDIIRYRIIHNAIYRAFSNNALVFAQRLDSIHRSTVSIFWFVTKSSQDDPPMRPDECSESLDASQEVFHCIFPRELLAIIGHL